MSNHKGLAAWQEAHRVADAALELAKRHWKPYLNSTFDQLTRASLSVQINISEGYGFGTARKFAHHLRIAKGSAAETGDLLELLLERGEIPQDIGGPALKSCIRCQALLFGLIKRYQVTTDKQT